MSKRQSVPRVERIFDTTRNAETYFDFLIPPGVGSAEAHIYLQAHLGSEMAERVEREHGSGETESSEDR